MKDTLTDRINDMLSDFLTNHQRHLLRPTNIVTDSVGKRGIGYQKHNIISIPMATHKER